MAKVGSRADLRPRTAARAVGDDVRGRARDAAAGEGIAEPIGAVALGAIQTRSPKPTRHFQPRRSSAGSERSPCSRLHSPRCAWASEHARARRRSRRRQDPAPASAPRERRRPTRDRSPLRRVRELDPVLRFPPLAPSTGRRARRNPRGEHAEVARAGRGGGAALVPWIPLLALPLDVDVEQTPEVLDLQPAFRRARLHGVVEEFLLIAAPRSDACPGRGRALDRRGVVGAPSASWLDERDAGRGRSAAPDARETRDSSPRTECHRSQR